MIATGERLQQLIKDGATITVTLDDGAQFTDPVYWLRYAKANADEWPSADGRWEVDFICVGSDRYHRLLVNDMSEDEETGDFEFATVGGQGLTVSDAVSEIVLRQLKDCATELGDSFSPPAVGGWQYGTK